MEVTANGSASLLHNKIQRGLDGIEACWVPKAAAKSREQTGCLEGEGLVETV